MHPQISVGLKHLPNQVEFAFLNYSNEDYRQISRNAVRPKSGLSLAVLQEVLGRGTQKHVGKQQMTCQLLETAGFVRLDAQHLQLLLG